MQQKLIVTLWKAQLKQFNKEDSLNCRLTYNLQNKSSKPTSLSSNLAWKETFIFPLGKQTSELRLDFINLKDGHQIHFAKDNVAESLSLGHAVVDVQVEGHHHGSLPCKLDILDANNQSIGKIFIEYQVIKTEVAYTVDKQMDYYYLLKLTNFKVTFVRNLKKTPRFYLRCQTEGRVFKQDLPFEEEDGVFMYNYPAKLYLKKQIQMEMELFVKDAQDYGMRKNDNQSESSYSQSIMTEKKTNKSSIGKKQKLLLELGKDKISAMMDLNFKKDVKITRKLPLMTMVKSQRREIGTIEFQVETFFRTKQQLQQLQEQKRGLNPQNQPKLQRKKSLVKQSNGIIIVNSILGKLQLFNDAMIQNKDMSIEIKLGKQSQESTILQKPGKQLIFIDTFVFKRTWEETMKIAIQLHNKTRQKIPTFFTQVNLRELFEIGRYVSKKVKLKDQNKNYCGQLVLDMIYKEQQEKKSPSLKDSMATISQIPQEQMQELKTKLKRGMIQERMKKRLQQKVKSKQLNSMSTLAVLQQNDIILPPLKSISRMQTLSPKAQKFKSANMFNVNGSIRFTRSPRFENKQDNEGYQSYTYVRDSDFDVRKRKGASIGYGNKHDFTKDIKLNPGVGRYEIPSVWDKYK